MVAERQDREAHHLIEPYPIPVPLLFAPVMPFGHP